MTDAAHSDRLAALRSRREGSKRGARRRPAEASRVLAAGAGTAAVLTMVTAMAQADQVVEIAEVSVPDSPFVSVPVIVDPVVGPSTATTLAPVEQAPLVQTITVARPVRAQVSNARTSASR